MCNVSTQSGVIRRERPEERWEQNAGSVRIEPFEGGRAGLRRRRPVWQSAAMGFEYDFDSVEKAREHCIVQIRSARKEFSGPDARRKQQMCEPKCRNSCRRHKQNTRIVCMPKPSMILPRLVNN